MSDDLVHCFTEAHYHGQARNQYYEPIYRIRNPHQANSMAPPQIIKKISSGLSLSMMHQTKKVFTPRHNKGCWAFTAKVLRKKYFTLHCINTYCSTSDARRFRPGFWLPIAFLYITEVSIMYGCINCKQNQHYQWTGLSINQWSFISCYICNSQVNKM